MADHARHGAEIGQVSLAGPRRSEFGIQINPKINRRVRDEEAPLIYG